MKVGVTGIVTEGRGLDINSEVGVSGILGVNEPFIARKTIKQRRHKITKITVEIGLSFFDFISTRIKFSEIYGFPVVSKKTKK